VNPVTTTVLLTSNDNPSTLGTNVDFTAKVSLGSQRGVATTGSVQLLDGSTVLRRVFQGALVSVTHSMTAIYSGDSHFGASTQRRLLR
jgi:hypothetical protein